MSSSTWGTRDPRNTFSVWYKSLSGAAILGAVASIGGALAIFSAITLLSDQSAITSTQEPTVLSALLGLLVFGISNLWFSIALMGFGLRIAQFAKARGVQSRFAPGWAIGGWFVPVASLVIPYLVLRDAAGLGSQEPEVRKRGVLAFWIWWIVLSNLTSIGLQLITSTNVVDAQNGWKLFAGTLAFFIVPFMMGRKLFAQIDADYRSLIV